MRTSRRTAAVAAFVTALLAFPTTAAQPASPFGDRSDERPAERTGGERPAGGRLDRIAATLRQRPLAVDPELEWMFDAATRRSIEQQLGDTRVPVLVAVVPTLTEDESGGDQERILQGLQRRLRRNALYVTVDDDARLDTASLGLPLALGIPFELRYPPLDDRPREQREADPRPPDHTTIPGRISAVLDAVRAADEGSPLPPIADADLSDLATLPGHYRWTDDDRGGARIGAGVAGLLVGLVAGAGIVAWRGVSRRTTGRRGGRRA